VYAPVEGDRGGGAGFSSLARLDMCIAGGIFNLHPKRFFFCARVCA